MYIPQVGAIIDLENVSWILRTSFCDKSLADWWQQIWSPSDSSLQKEFIIIIQVHVDYNSMNSGNTCTITVFQ